MLVGSLVLSLALATTGTTGSTGGTTGSSGAEALVADICAPCTLAADCPHSGETCVTQGSGGYCAPPCTQSAECGEGNTCTEMTEGGGAQFYGCMPSSGLCAGAVLAVPTSDICDSCQSASDCPHAHEQCVFEASTGPGYCAPQCTESAQCGAGNVCTPMEDDQGNKLYGCYPASQTCASPPKATTPDGDGGTGCASAPGSPWSWALVASVALLGPRRRR